MASAAMAFACSDVDPDAPETPGEQTGDGEPAAPEVIFSDITSTSFTASWKEVSGADGYRYEVTFVEDGATVTVAFENIEETSFALSSLQPAVEYKVRVAARAEGKTSRNWFEGSVTTAGGSDMSFTVIPVEKYSSDGYVYPHARVETSVEDVYYWVSAVPVESKDEARAWIQEDIQYYIDYYGVGWDELVEAGLIMHGTAESLGFNFTNYGDFCFAAVPVSNTLSGITVSSDVYFSHQFFAASLQSTISFPADKDDYIGEWALVTSATLKSEGGYFVEDKGEIFNVTISAAADGALEMRGWGGSRNKYSSSPLRLGYADDGDGYGAFTITLPQTITTDSGVEWQYYSWCTFYGGATDVTYFPFDETYGEQIPLAEGFSGFAANLNRTVIKIFGKQFTASDGTGFLITALWPYGTDASGEGVYLNGEHSEPVEMYYLVRKDVAEGDVLEIPDNPASSSSLHFSVPQGSEAGMGLEELVEGGLVGEMKPVHNLFYRNI